MADVNSIGGPVTPTPPAVGQPANQVPVPVTPPANNEPQKMVPLNALQEERSKRQEGDTDRQNLQVEIDKLKAYIQTEGGYNQTPTPQPQGQYAYAPQQPQGQPYGQPQGQPPPQGQPQADLADLWESDPRKAFQTEMMVALQWRDWVDASVDGQMHELTTKYPDFKQYEGNVRHYLRQMPLNQRSSPGVATAAYFMVKGQNADNLAKQYQAQNAGKVNAGQAAAGVPVGAYGTPAPVGGPTITPQEMAVANAMGMTPQDYVAHRKGGQ